MFWKAAALVFIFAAGSGAAGIATGYPVSDGNGKSKWRRTTTTTATTTPATTTASTTTVGTTTSTMTASTPDASIQNWTDHDSANSPATGYGYDEENDGSEGIDLTYTVRNANGAQCSLDGGPYSSCYPSPWSGGRLNADAQVHTLSVRATRSSDGAVDPTPATARLIVCPYSNFNCNVSAGATATIPAVTTTTSTTTTTTTTTPPPPSGTVLFRGDYETGNFAQWAEPQSACTGGGYSVSNVGNSCDSILSAPVHQGSRAAQFQISPHTSAAATAERAEVYASVAQTGGYEGQEWYYAWSTLFPAAGNPLGFWPSAANWNVFTDWHNPGGCNSNIQLGINATGALPYLYFEDDNFASGNCSSPSSMLYTNLGNLQYDRWYDFVVHVKWSRSASVGFVELWLDGVKVVPLTYRQTMADVAGASVYWKQGFYRSAFGGLNTAYHDGARRGDTLAAVTG